MSDTILKKKKSLLFILEILKKYSDVYSPLTITKIAELLLIKYELKVGRKAIKRNLENFFRTRIRYRILCTKSEREKWGRRGNKNRLVFDKRFYRF